VLDTLTEKDFQEVFQKWRRRWDRCLHAGGNYFEGDGGRQALGEFYEFYSVSPENFGYTPRIKKIATTTSEHLYETSVSSKREKKT
jgi:hypothetical protein